MAVPYIFYECKWSIDPNIDVMVLKVASLGALNAETI